MDDIILDEKRRKQIDEILKKTEREMAENPQKFLENSMSFEEFQKRMKAKFSEISASEQKNRKN